MKSLLESKRVHMIGVKGAGMAALAEILVGRGIHVGGSDTSERFFTDAVLRRRGVRYVEEFSPKNIPKDVDTIIYSTAYTPETNTELASAFRRAKETPVRVMSYPEAVGDLTRERLSILVSGTHGKTTTSALLSETLKFLGADPLSLVGSAIPAWGGNALLGEGKYFVLEADEYQNKFQYYEPWSVIVTSLDWDHPDFFPNIESYGRTFRELVKRIPPHGFLVFWGDSVAVAKVAQDSRAQKRSYGFLPENDIRVADYEPVREGPFRQTFRLFEGERDLGMFRLRLAGKHNALNAAAVVTLLLALKFDIEKMRQGMENFFGTARRFEYVGEKNGALVYDDYAHHPEEIKATLLAFRELFPDRNIIAVFHPHTFSRTKALLPEFAQSFDSADRVIILDIYGSARETAGGVSSAELVALVNRYQHDKAMHIPTIKEAISYLASVLDKNDLVVTFGAGNVWEVGKGIVGK